MRKYHYILTTLFLLIIWKTSFAHYYKQYNTGNGLLSNYIYHVVRDSKGYLWICTDKGVVKYNGLVFETFNTLNGLTDNNVFNCHEDFSGRIWFYTFNGKYCYYQNDSIYNSNNDSLLRKLPVLSYINTMYNDVADSALYIGHVAGSILRIKNQTIERIEIKYNEFKKLRNIYRVGGKLKAITQDEWLELNNDTVISRQEMPYHDSYLYNNDLITSDDSGVKLYKDEKLIWKINDKDVNLFNIYHLYYDGKSHVLCGTRNGLIVYNITTGRKQHFFENTRITSTAEDIQGNYWFSSFGSGIFRLNKAELNNSRFLANIKDFDLIRNKSGQIFIKKGNNISTVIEKNGVINLKQLPQTIGNNIEVVCLTDSAFYYCPLFSSGGLVVADLFSGIQTRLSNLYLTKGFECTNQRFLFFNSTDFNVIKFSGSRYKILDSFAMDNTVHTEHYIKERNSLYFLSDNIFYQYNVNSFKLRIIDTVNSLGGNNDLAFENGHIILLVNNNEVIIYSGKDTIKREHSFNLTRPVYSLEKVAPGKYIINTDEGYEVLKITTSPLSVNSRKIVYPFEQKDILFIYPFGNNLVCKVGDELYSFPVSTLNKHKGRPKLHVRKVLLNGTKEVKDIYNINANNKSDIKLLLSPVYFGNDDLTFRYRIIDDDELRSWYISKSKELNFLFNHSGQYSIQIQAVAAGFLYSNIETVHLDIKPSFLSSAPFYLLCAVCVVVLSLLLFRFYNRRRKKHFNNEMNYLQLEHKAVNSMLNPHFVFNAINNIQNLVNEDSREQANEYLATLSTMIRQNIENLQFNLIPLKKELNLIQNYIELQNLRFSNKLEYILENNVDTEIHIPPLLIHTFVENAIVHGYDKIVQGFEIVVKTELTPDNYLLVTITDNGVGINNSNKKLIKQKGETSLGISFTQKRLKRLSEFYKVDYTLQLNDLSDSGKNGTEVVILIYSKFKELAGTDKILPLIK